MSHDFWLRPDSKDDPNVQSGFDDWLPSSAPDDFFGVDRTRPTRFDEPLRKATWRERRADTVERVSHWLQTFILTGRVR